MIMFLHLNMVFLFVLSVCGKISLIEILRVVFPMLQLHAFSTLDLASPFLVCLSSFMYIMIILSWACSRKEVLLPLKDIIC